MDESFLYNLLSSLLCLLPICAGALFIGGAAFLIIRTAIRQSKPLTPQQANDAAENLEAKVEQMMGRLRAWNPEALSDLSADWDAKWSRWGRDLNAHGVIPSLSRPREAAYVAFALKIRGAFEPEGLIHARVTSRVFDYRLSRAGVEIRVDRAPFGRIQPDGQLLDAEGNAIGEAKRPGGMPVIFRVGGMALKRDQREREYPLILNGRSVGRLANPSIQMFNAIELRKKIFAPAAVPAEGVSEHEALWLTALAILQVAGYNLLESVWTN